MPEATQLKDYGSWKQSRAYVDKDAQKVTILEPGKEYEREDGSKAVGYNAKIRRKRCGSYRPVGIGSAV